MYIDYRKSSKSLLINLWDLVCPSPTFVVPPAFFHSNVCHPALVHSKIDILNIIKDSGEGAQSLVDGIREAAEDALIQQGMVLEKTSGKGTRCISSNCL